MCGKVAGRGDRAAMVRVRVRVRMAGTSTESRYKTTVDLHLIFTLHVQVEHLDLAFY